MKPFCEIVVSDMLPALRALITKELMRLGLNQVQISKRLGITQPAISQYTRELRGRSAKLLTSNDKVMESIKLLAYEIVNGNVKTGELHIKICGICKKIREEHLLCKLHKENYPSIEVCEICFK